MTSGNVLRRSEGGRRDFSSSSSSSGRKRAETSRPRGEEGNEEESRECIVEFNRADDLPSFLENFLTAEGSSPPAVRGELRESGASFLSGGGGGRKAGKERRRLGAGARKRGEKSEDRSGEGGACTPAGLALAKEIERRKRREERRKKEEEAEGGRAAAEGGTEDEEMSRSSFVKSVLSKKKTKKTGEGGGGGSLALEEEEKKKKKKKRKRKREDDGCGLDSLDSDSVSTCSSAPSLKKKPNNRRGGNSRCTDTSDVSPSSRLGNQKDLAQADEKPPAVESEKPRVDSSVEKKKKKKLSEDLSPRTAHSCTRPSTHVSGEGEGVPSANRESEAEVEAEREEERKDEKRRISPQHGGQRSGEGEGKRAAKKKKKKKTTREEPNREREGKEAEEEQEAENAGVRWERSEGKTLQGRTIKIRRVAMPRGGGGEQEGEGGEQGWKNEWRSRRGGGGEDGERRRRTKTRSKQKNIRKDNRPDHLKPPHLQLMSKVRDFPLAKEASAGERSSALKAQRVPT